MFSLKVEKGLRRFYAALRMARREGWEAEVRQSGRIRLWAPPRIVPVREYCPLTCALMVLYGEYRPADTADYHYAGSKFGLEVKPYRGRFQSEMTASKLIASAADNSRDRLRHHAAPERYSRETRRIRKAMLRIFDLTDHSA